MKLFYTPNITDNKSYVLNETESKHAIKVLRLTINDIITLVDGKGCFYEAKIVSDHHKKCEVEIVKTIFEQKKNPSLHIAIAPTKNNDRLEWLIEKATEIGISEITPIICDNSERKVLKTDRLEKRAIAAMKQSLKATLPQINAPCKYSDIISKEFSREKYIAHCYSENQTHFKKCYESGKDAIVLIGPEGDFSKNEVELALKNNFKPISLGESRLRTETAGLYICNAFNFINE
ncbi:MAG: 16S rRNA (uracil(1498)-N(3))-methyltransferase [Vicingaceae bacterium]|nr:16S rRNA (uracil(1498)-N(3))-methyltransferase [Vicingaceae bacterium]